MILHDMHACDASSLYIYICDVMFFFVDVVFLEHGPWENVQVSQGFFLEGPLWKKLTC